ncbi:hypothetical protein BH11MYX1_BH11MYX1_15590 [soil metagenome]
MAAKSSPLHQAIDLRQDAGRAEKVAAALAAGANPNTPDKDGRTPLARALSQHDADLFDALIAAGADAKKPQKGGATLINDAWNAMWNHGGFKVFRDKPAFVRILDGLAKAAPSDPCLEDVEKWLKTTGSKFLKAKPAKAGPAAKPAKGAAAKGGAQVPAIVAMASAAIKTKKFKHTTADAVIASLRPVLGYELDAVNKNSKTARSFLGGMPLVPDDFEWPEGDNGPYAFLAQIDFAECKPYDFEGRLPATGIAYFFAASDEDTVANEKVLPGVVVYVGDADDLAVADRPEFEDEVEAVFKKRTMRFHPAVRAKPALLDEASDLATYIAALKVAGADWSGYLLSEPMFDKFSLDAKTQTLLLHLDAGELQRVAKRDTSTIYVASSFDFVLSHKDLKKAAFGKTEIWFDFFH